MAKTKSERFRPLRDKALFLSDYWVALRRKPASVKAEFLDAYCRMAFEGVETEHSEDCEEVFCMCRKGLRKSLQGYINKCQQKGIDPTTGEVLAIQSEESLPTEMQVHEDTPIVEQPSQTSPFPVTDERRWDGFGF